MLYTYPNIFSLWLCVINFFVFAGYIQISYGLNKLCITINTYQLLSLPFVFLTINSIFQITQILNALMIMTSSLETNIVAVERLKEYKETPQVCLLILLNFWRFCHVNELKFLFTFSYIHSNFFKSQKSTSSFCRYITFEIP